MFLRRAGAGMEDETDIGGVRAKGVRASSGGGQSKRGFGRNEECGCAGYVVSCTILVLVLPLFVVPLFYMESKCVMRALQTCSQAVQSNGMPSRLKDSC